MGFEACCTIISNALVRGSPAPTIVAICLMKTTLSFIGTPPILISANFSQSKPNDSFMVTMIKPLS